ncbi:flavodoxin [uncultured Rikenella sp.]|uniref:flavodoxin n=1 Tax=uncultured Rikenella sp. TaxID=368003 RepID=UPI002623E5AC|nr:flavodoxin [uncultured Rikenella sp.]
MNRLSFTAIFASMITLGLTSCSSSNAQQKDSREKALVLYFSATGTTASVARLIAEQTGADLCEIKPAVPYTAADLDWRNSRSRSSVEMNNPTSRPAIMNVEKDIAAYDLIYLGYPIWWDQAPRIINTFIENHNLKGKRVIPFATSGSSSIDNSVKQLKATYPDIAWEKGKLLNNVDKTVIRQWTDRFVTGSKQR